jgi:very-short-patch-repair endonuclease
MSNEWKDRVSKNFLGKKHTPEYKKIMRLYAIKRIEDQVLNGEPLIPCVGKKERFFLNEVENILNLKIHRQFPVHGYFIDGYIPELKLAFEFDGMQNHKNSKKDFQRQQEIEKVLDCCFFRVTDLEWGKNKQEILSQIRRIKNDIG